jgi:N-acetylmuramoyl-L-alanine amidase
MIMMMRMRTMRNTMMRKSTQNLRSNRTTERSVFSDLSVTCTEFRSRRKVLGQSLPIFIGASSLLQLPSLEASIRSTKLAGIPHFDLATVGQSLGMQSFWTKPSKILQLKSKWTTMEFEVEGRDFLLNRRKIYLGHPVRLHNNRPYITEKDYLLTIRPILAPQTLSKRPLVQKIVLDPGHGGKDFGAQNTTSELREKDLTLDVTLRLSRKLQTEGFQVYLTRKDDKYIPLDQRGELASRVKADLFISIHFNSVGRPNVSGLETFVLPQPWTPSSSRSKLDGADKMTYPGNASDGWNSLAGFYLHRALIDQIGVEDRGLKRSRFRVLKNLTCPGMLVELGFISHPQTAGKLRQSQYRELLAQTLLSGIQTYKKTQLRLGGQT